MQDYINFAWGTGFAIIMGFVLLIIFIYTIIKLKKQAEQAEEHQREKKRIQFKSFKKE